MPKSKKAKPIKKSHKNQRPNHEERDLEEQVEELGQFQEQLASIVKEDEKDSIVAAFKFENIDLFRLECSKAYKLVNCQN